MFPYQPVDTAALTSFTTEHLYQVAPSSARRARPAEPRGPRHSPQIAKFCTSSLIVHGCVWVGDDAIRRFDLEDERTREGGPSTHGWGWADGAGQTDPGLSCSLQIQNKRGSWSSQGETSGWFLIDCGIQMEDLVSILIHFSLMTSDSPVFQILASECCAFNNIRGNFNQKDLIKIRICFLWDVSSFKLLFVWTDGRRHTGGR